MGHAKWDPNDKAVPNKTKLVPDYQLLFIIYSYVQSIKNFEKN